jgi:hypothetical protein
VKRRVLALVVASCHSAAAPVPVHNSSARAARPTASEDACALIDAMLAIDNHAYQELYANRECGVDAPLHHPLVIDVREPTSLFPRGLTCPGRRYQLFHGEQDLRGAIIEFRVVPHGSAWSFMATVVEPNPPSNPDGSFDVVDNYCHAGFGIVERTAHGWHSYEGSD